MGQWLSTLAEMRVQFVCLLVTLVALAYAKPAEEQSGSDQAASNAEDRGDLSALFPSIPAIPSLTDILAQLNPNDLASVIASIAEQLGVANLTDAITTAVDSVNPDDLTDAITDVIDDVDLPYPIRDGENVEEVVTESDVEEVGAEEETDEKKVKKN